MVRDVSRLPRANWSRTGRSRSTSVLFEEDALRGTLLGCVEHRHLEFARHGAKTGPALRQEPATLADVAQAAVHHNEHLRAQLFTDTVANAKILVDPHFHAPDD